jgi:mannose-1-phosphate guanylyltransferase/phosphomannomutase
MSSIPPAVIMAGGRSERMRATFSSDHKSLVRVLGIPLLERNLCKLLAAGFRDITVTMNAREPAIERYVQARGRALATAKDATIECLKESEPLGTIGALGEFRSRAESILVVNVDNLTALGLRELVNHHLRSRAAMTVAVHQETFRIPFGEVLTSDGYIVRYLEKPARQICISSGTYVLGPRACDLIPKGRRFDVPDLIDALDKNGQPVAAFEHAAPWIDINDAAAIPKAEQLVTEHLTAFEYWDHPPDCEIAALMLCSPAGILVEYRPHPSSRYSGLWDIPGEHIEPGDRSPRNAISRKFEREPAWCRGTPEFLTSFDDLDTTTGHLIRHHVFFVLARDTLPLPPLAGLKWMPLEEKDQTFPLSPPLATSLASLRKHL